MYSQIKKKCVHGAAALRTDRKRCRKKLLKNNIRSSADVVEALTEPLIVLPLFFFASISVTVRLQPLINHAVCVKTIKNNYTAWFSSK